MKTRVLHKTRQKVWQGKSSLQDFQCALTKISETISGNSVQYLVMIKQNVHVVSPLCNRVRATNLLVDKKTKKIS